MLFSRPCVTSFTGHRPILCGLTSFCAQFNQPLSCSNVNCSSRRFLHKSPSVPRQTSKSHHPSISSSSKILHYFESLCSSSAPRLGAGPHRPSPPPLTSTLISVSLGSLELISKTWTADNDFAALGEGEYCCVFVVMAVVVCVYMQGPKSILTKR